MPITNLDTTTAVEKEEFILRELAGTTLDSALMRVDTMRNIALAYLRNEEYLSQDARCHYIEWVLICDDYTRHLTVRKEHADKVIAEARHAERF